MPRAAMSMPRASTWSAACTAPAGTPAPPTARGSRPAGGPGGIAEEDEKKPPPPGGGGWGEGSPPEHSVRPPRLLRPLRTPAVALLWGGLAASAIGDQLFAVVLSW